MFCAYCPRYELSLPDHRHGAGLRCNPCAENMCIFTLHQSSDRWFYPGRNLHVANRGELWSLYSYALYTKYESSRFKRRHSKCNGLSKVVNHSFSIQIKFRNTDFSDEYKLLYFERLLFDYKTAHYVCTEKYWQSPSVAPLKHIAHSYTVPGVRLFLFISEYAAAILNRTSEEFG